MKILWHYCLGFSIRNLKLIFGIIKMIAWKGILRARLSLGKDKPLPLQITNADGKGERGRSI